MKMHRAYNMEVEVEVGRPVYYTVGEEVRMGRVARISGEMCVVIRDGLREQVPLKYVTVAKRAWKEMRDEYVG